ncbi:MAG: hypothetical protein JW940_34565 [Polyangiaceae bacterium]|nr:hypothetical protein [Polyangiaceae bacterium]
MHRLVCSVPLATITARRMPASVARWLVRIRQQGVSGALVVATCLVSACRASKPHEGSSPSAVRGPKAKEQGRCVVSHPSAVFTLGDVGSPSSVSVGEEDGSGPDDDQPKDVPFSVEVGEALAYPSGFAVAALKSSTRSTHAIVALVDEQAASGRSIDLGAVHGAAPPPQLAVGPRRVVVAVADSDASGGTVRLAAIEDPARAAKVSWGREPEEGWDTSGTFDVGLNDAHGLLAWEEATGGSACSRIKTVRFGADTLNPSKSDVVSTRGMSSESPRMVSRPGGFWLAWISRRGCAEGRTRRSGGGRGSDDEHGPVLDLGAGVLEVLRLNSKGERSGEPVRVTRSLAHVIAYDIVALPDGGALLVFRDDTASPGAERQVVRLARVGADGTVERNELDDEGIGAGVPSLLVDTQSVGGPSVWLALEGASESTRLARLSPSGALLGGLDPEPAVGVGDVLSARRGRLLVGSPRGRAVELSVVTCRGDEPRSASR